MIIADIDLPLNASSKLGNQGAPTKIIKAPSPRTNDPTPMNYSTNIPSLPPLANAAGAARQALEAAVPITAGTPLNVADLDAAITETAIIKNEQGKYTFTRRKQFCFDNSRHC
jgi:hypothetical protein